MHASQKVENGSSVVQKLNVTGQERLPGQGSSYYRVCFALGHRGDEWWNDATISDCDVRATVIFCHQKSSATLNKTL